MCYVHIRFFFSRIQKRKSDTLYKLRIWNNEYPCGMSYDWRSANNAQVIITHAFRLNSVSFGLLRLRDRKTSFILRTLHPPRTTARFFPAGVSNKGQKTPRRWFRGGPRSSFFDHRSAENSAILLRESQLLRFPPLCPLTPPPVPGTVCVRSPPSQSGSLSRGWLQRRTLVLFILWIPNTRAGARAALYYNLLTDVIITIPYKWPVAGCAKVRTC